MKKSRKERCKMMYPYMKLADNTEIVHSHIIEHEGVKSVVVHFERPTEKGFDSARCELPQYNWIEKTGYKQKEMEFFEKLLKNNTHLLYKYSEIGGIGGF